MFVPRVTLESFNENVLLRGEYESDYDSEDSNGSLYLLIYYKLIFTQT